LVTVVVLLLLNRVVRRYQRKIHALATLDSLTDLPNRRGFDLLAAQALQEATRETKPLSALMLDLDHFKRLNDTHGHLAGDEVLKGFAQVLQGCLRQADIICRWGGEEFIVLLKDTDSRNALLIAEKIRLHTEQQVFEYDGVALRVTTSVGLTGLQADDTLPGLIARADQALYRAKQSGRNRINTELAKSCYE
jgi:diguanylate cyclase (GGDEF)-like protein